MSTRMPARPPWSGLPARDVDRETQRHGLAVPLGFISDVGVGGLTLGGGLGYLTRRFGWTVDNLLEVEIVTADGEVRRAGRDEHPDLFWGVRGAGANLGVVTRFTYRLHPVGPTVHGGLVAWPFERAADVTAAYRRITAEAPRELAVWLVLLHGPPAPFVPAEWHGRRLCAMAVCYSGTRRRRRRTGTDQSAGYPVFDLLGRDAVHRRPVLFGRHRARRHALLLADRVPRRTDDGLLDTLCELFRTCPNPMADIGVLHLSGALNERAEDDGAVGNRDAHYVVRRQGHVGARRPERADGSGTGFEPVATGFARTAPDAPTSTSRPTTSPTPGCAPRTAPNYTRLAALKHRYDPDNLFRSNRNVAPSSMPCAEYSS